MWINCNFLLFWMHILVLWIRHLHVFRTHPDWRCVKEREKVLLQRSRWVDETSAVCTVCTIHLSHVLTASPPASIPSTLGLNTLHCIPRVDSREKLSPALRSRAIIWLPQRGVVAICMSAWCLHVCPWVGCHPLPSSLNWLAWQRR